MPYTATQIETVQPITEQVDDTRLMLLYANESEVGDFGYLHLCW